jgi:ferredoxin
MTVAGDRSAELRGLLLQLFHLDEPRDDVNPGEGIEYQIDYNEKEMRQLCSVVCIKCGICADVSMTLGRSSPMGPLPI